MQPAPTRHDVSDAERLVEPAVQLVQQWLNRAAERETRTERKAMADLRGVVTDPDGVAFVMRFVDRVVRPDNDRVAAGQLASIVARSQLPAFLSWFDKVLLRAGGVLAPLAPRVVMPLARGRMRGIVGQLVAPAEDRKLRRHLAAIRRDGYAINVNLLGEAVLGENEAARRMAELLDLLKQPDIDYVSVKISAVASQLNPFAHDDSLRRVIERVTVLVDAAAQTSPPTFINFDMEEYHDLELTTEAFIAVLSADEYRHVEAGIVLQAYLPDALPVLKGLTDWATKRHDTGGAGIKIRLVKGANLAMEQVDAAMHGWEQAPFTSKAETDANYKRCVDWLLRPERMAAVRLGLASHNLFDVAWTHLLSLDRGVADRVQFEMLHGMAPAQAATVDESLPAGETLLLYTPAVRSENFDVAISYLFRRLEENAADDNFLRHLFDLSEDTAIFDQQAQLFRQSVVAREQVRDTPRRNQDRSQPATPAYEIGEHFINEPETDPTLPANRRWIGEVSLVTAAAVSTPLTSLVPDIDRIIEVAQSAGRGWSRTSMAERQQICHRLGDQLADRRAELVATMMGEARKTFVEADGEVAEAIDFARWYGDRARELDEVPNAEFLPFGVVSVVPPWNFPVAIPAGGVLASLAAGNAVILKPAPETPRCAELIAEAAWAAGVPRDVLQFVRTADDDAGRQLIVGADAVILTGASETADLFRTWKPDLELVAETSGKNVLIITPNADIDLAVSDLVRSAFGHSGQKCSAASLAILVGDVATSERFRRQLVDAVQSLTLGHSTDLATDLGPLIGTANDRLLRGLTELDAEEQWLVEPRLNDSQDLWSPGIRTGVAPGSWFHRTECFGPVLGLMAAETLDEAIEVANSSSFGLTGGIQSLDPNEVRQWTETIQVGNGYVNRPITGAIVQRQPFGGWKRSSVGAGRKAGGPNYLTQLGRWESDNGDNSTNDYEELWQTHFAVEHDDTALFCEANVFRYRPLDRIGLRFGSEATDADRLLLRHAASTCGVRVVESDAASESQADFAARLASLDVERVRLVGESVNDVLRRAAIAAHCHIATGDVLPAGRIELQNFVREQAISTTLHRFGNLVATETDTSISLPGLGPGGASD